MPEGEAAGGSGLARSATITRRQNLGDPGGVAMPSTHLYECADDGAYH